VVWRHLSGLVGWSIGILQWFQHTIETSQSKIHLNAYTASMFNINNNKWWKNFHEMLHCRNGHSPQKVSSHTVHPSLPCTDPSMVFARWHQSESNLIHDAQTWQATWMCPQTSPWFFQQFLHCPCITAYRYWLSNNCYDATRQTLYQVGSWCQSHTWFLGPTQLISPNSISITSAIFAGHTVMSNRLTWRRCLLQLQQWAALVAKLQCGLTTITTT